MTFAHLTPEQKRAVVDGWREETAAMADLVYIGDDMLDHVAAGRLLDEFNAEDFDARR